MSGFTHVGSDDLLRNVLAAVGFKAYEIVLQGSHPPAEAAGAGADVAVLQQSMREEQDTGDWLGEHLPGLIQTYPAP